jgi:ubiquinone/menaquinone biosynthesis C-methylase UbiE
MRKWGRRNAPFYGLWARLLDIAGYREMMRRVARALPPDGPILDVGCGSGEGLAVLREDSSHDRTIVACDLSPEFLAVARRTEGHARYFASDAQGLAIRSATCGAALSYGVLGHLLDPVTALRELARVVRPGGLIAVWTRTDGFVSRAIVLLFEGLNRGNSFRLHEPRTVRRSLEGSGVVILSEEKIAGGRLWMGRRE